MVDESQLLTDINQKPLPGQKKFPPYKPIAYFGGNLLLGGLSYIMLRQYKRFFILIGIIFVTAFFPYGNRIGFVIIIGSAIDAYNIAKGFKEKSQPEPVYNQNLTYVAVAIWVLSLILSIWSVFIVANNPVTIS